jgi:hypothetical protein
MVANNHFLADVSIVPNLTIPADDRGPFDHRAIFHHRALANKYVLPNKGSTLTAIEQSRFQMSLKILFDLFQGIPGIGATFEDLCMVGLA